MAPSRHLAFVYYTMLHCKLDDLLNEMAKRTFSRLLSGRFGDAYREFTSEDASYRSVCLLNQYDLDMFVLIIIGSDGTVQVCQQAFLAVKT